MRLFVGVELDDSVRQRTVELSTALRKQLERVRGFHARWIEPSNLHLTLAFIGEVTQETADAMRVALERPFEVRAFDLRLAGFGAFPPSGAPRVLWMGVASGAALLSELHTEVETRLQPFGYAPERRAYAAHLTLARIKEAPRGGHAAIRTALGDFPAEAGSSRADRVTLFRSRLSPKGASYEALLRVPLA